MVEAYTSFKIMKNFMGEGGDSFTITLKNQWHFYFAFHFAKRYLNNELLSYEVTLAKKCKKTVSEQVK